ADRTQDPARVDRALRARRIDTDAGAGNTAKPFSPGPVVSKGFPAFAAGLYPSQPDGALCPDGRAYPPITLFDCDRHGIFEPTGIYPGIYPLLGDFPMPVPGSARPLYCP